MIILIATCKHYADITPALVHYFNKYWTDCAYRKVFINSPIKFNDFENIDFPDKGWTGNIIEFINKYNINENILLIHDDYILTELIDFSVVEKADIFLTDNCESVGYIRLVRHSDNKYNQGYGWSFESHKEYNSDYNYCDIDLNYKENGGYTRLPISHQPAIWNPNFIKKHFNANWSPWQQEVLGSRELCDKGTVNGIPCNYDLLTTKLNIFNYCNAIRDGKYSQEFVNLIKNDPDMKKFKLKRLIANSELDQKEMEKLTARQTDGTYPDKLIFL